MAFGVRSQWVVIYDLKEIETIPHRKDLSFDILASVLSGFKPRLHVSNSIPDHTQTQLSDTLLRRKRKQKKENTMFQISHKHNSDTHLLSKKKKKKKKKVKHSLTLDSQKTFPSSVLNPAFRILE